MTVVGVEDVVVVVVVKVRRGTISEFSPVTLLNVAHIITEKALLKLFVQ